MTHFERTMYAFVSLFIMFLAAWLDRYFTPASITRKTIEHDANKLLDFISERNTDGKA